MARSVHQPLAQAPESPRLRSVGSHDRITKRLLDRSHYPRPLSAASVMRTAYRARESTRLVRQAWLRLT